MQPSTLSCATLIALCLVLLACGDEPTTEAEVEQKPEVPKVVEFAEVVVEIDSGRYFPESADRTALDLLRSIVTENASDDINVQVNDKQAGQLHLTIKPADAAGKFYTNVKEEFDQSARDAITAELSAQASIVKAKAEAFQEYQQLMKQFQLGVATVEVDGQKLDRRKLDRLVETTLASQIAAEKRIEALQKQVDRKQYATLLRVR